MPVTISPSEAFPLIIEVERLPYIMDIKLVIILTLSSHWGGGIGLVQSKSFEEAMDELLETVSDIGTGICTPSHFKELFTKGNECQEMKQAQFVHSHTLQVELDRVRKIRT